MNINSLFPYNFFSTGLNNKSDKSKKDSNAKLDQALQNRQNNIYAEEYKKSKISNNVAKITSKLELGAELSDKELEYLKINAPALYEEAMKIKLERTLYKEALESCQTKEQAGQLHMIKMQQKGSSDYSRAATEDEYKNFKKTDEYKALPKDMEEKFKKDLQLPGKQANENISKVPEQSLNQKADTQKVINKLFSGVPLTPHERKHLADHAPAFAKIAAEMDAVKAKTESVQNTALPAKTDEFKQDAKPKDSSSKLTRRLISARSQFEVRQIKSEVAKEIASLRMIASTSKEDEILAKAFIKKMEKILTRSNIKLDDLDKEDAIRAEKSRAQQRKNARLADDKANELDTSQAKRRRKENGYLLENARNHFQNGFNGFQLPDVTAVLPADIAIDTGGDIPTAETPIADAPAEVSE